VVEQRRDHRIRARGIADVADARGERVEPDDAAGPEVDQRRERRLPPALRDDAKADRAAEQAQRLHRDPSRARETVLGMQEQRIVIARRAAEPDCVVAQRPVEPAPLGRQRDGL
jgi:hypothetical protein